MHRIILMVALLHASLAQGRSLEELERGLQRTPPVTTAFVEYRFSHLLEKPLRSSGTLEYRADGTLARHVDTPRRETTEVTGDTLRIARAGRPDRTLSLARAPQLRVLLGSFRALLEGRLAPLAQDFEITFDDQATRWTLVLAPREPALARHLERITVYGSGDRPACVEAVEPDGDGAFTLLSDTNAVVADAASPTTRAGLEQLCRGTAAAASSAPR